MSKTKIVAIVGPTACGKTRLSIELAKRLDGEVVSADSMQIYKGMDIGTAKPTALEIQGVPHHLIDFLPCDKEFSVAEYVALANEKIANIHARGKVLFLVGGTGLYVSSLLSGTHFVEQKSDPALREALRQKLERDGGEALLRELAAFDEETAKKLHPNDSLRIIRAIEIYKLTGITMTQHVANSTPADSPYEPLMFGLTYKNREALYEKINARVDKMLKAGLLDEARKVLASNCSKTAMNAICYKELAPYLSEECSLEEAVENLKMQTRRYAKRQLTWFRRDERIKWIFLDDYLSFADVADFCAEIIERYKSS